MDTVLSDHYLVAMILDFLNQDKDLAFVYSQLVNRTFLTSFRSLKPSFNFIRAWWRKWRSIPSSVDLRKISKVLAKSRVMYNPPQRSDLIPWYAYYGFAEGVEARLESLSYKDAWAEINVKIPIKTEDQVYMSLGIFDIIARVGDLRVFRAILDWYMRTFAESDKHGSAYILNLNHYALYFYGRENMIQEIEDIDDDDLPPPLADIVSIEEYFEERAEFYSWARESTESVQERLYKTIHAHVIESRIRSTRMYISGFGFIDSLAAVLLLALAGGDHYTQYRTIARLIRGEAALDSRIYFERIKNLWSSSLHYPERKVIEDIQFALNLGIEAIPCPDLVELASQCGRNELTEFLKTFTGKK